MFSDEQLHQFTTIENMAEEFYADLGDARRTARAVQIGLAFTAAPDRSFPEMFSNDADLEGFYRFERNGAVTWQAVLQPHIDRTALRAALVEDLLFIHDSTEASYDRHWSDVTRMHLSHLSKGRQGFHLHLCLAATGDGRRVPLGVMHMQPFVHKKDLEGDTEAHAFWQLQGGLYENEAERWFVGVEVSEAAVEEMGLRPIHVADREADSYCFMAWLLQRNSRFILRCEATKRLGRITLAQGGGDFKHLPFFAEIKDIHIGDRPDNRIGTKKQKHPTREGRKVTLEVRAAKIRVPRARNRASSGYSRIPWEELPDTIEVNLVEAIERNPPEGEEPVRWLLLTTEPVETAEQAVAVVKKYLRRWAIEDFNKCIKTGCKLEERQMETAANLLRVTALILPTAWRLLMLRDLGETQPDVSWRAVLDPLEFRILCGAMPKAKLNESSTAQAVYLAIAALGGHLKHNGRPGWQTIWRGWRKLNDYVKGARLAGIET